MCKTRFIPFNHVDPEDFLPIVNDNEVRRHLIAHPLFDSVGVRSWVEEKIGVDSLPGCRVRAVYIDGTLAGWCGIQPDADGYELAIVLSQRFWGMGIGIFKTVMRWACELGHREIHFHLLDSRPDYRSLKKVARSVHKTTLLGRRFTTYLLPVDG